MSKSENINELAKALSAAQAKIRGAEKNSENPFFKSKYANLASVWDACRDPLTENGLSVTQTSDVENGQAVLVTTMLHTSGQWISGKLPIITKDQSPQGIGSAISYYRRYALMAAVGIAAADDDGESAMGRDNRLGNEDKIDRTLPPQLKAVAGDKPTAPLCCERVMMISKYHEGMWYCPNCKGKRAM